MPDRKLSVLIAFCFVVLVASLWHGFQRDSAPAFTLAGLAFLAFFALYAVGVLGYKVGGSALSLEARIEDVEQSNLELQQVARALAKSLVVISDGAGRYNGPGVAHTEMVNELLKPIEHLLDQNLVNNTAAEIDSRVRLGALRPAAEDTDPRLAEEPRAAGGLGGAAGGVRDA